jgi:nitrogen fixation/metabolism regulation signal transduction histidine kinase
VNGLKALVDEFRNYARLPAAQPDYVDLSVLIQEVMGLYASDPRIQAQIENSACWVWADRGQLIQVIHNLVQNAQDAVEDQASGRIAIVCQRLHQDSGPEVCRVRVEDNGPGFSPGIIHRVFEPYVTTKPKGTGLGLAIVKKIMEENQAAIAVRNRTDAQGVILGVTVELEFAYRPPVSENSSYV